MHYQNFQMDVDPIVSSSQHYVAVEFYKHILWQLGHTHRNRMFEWKLILNFALTQHDLDIKYKTRVYQSVRCSRDIQSTDFRVKLFKKKFKGEKTLPKILLGIPMPVKDNLMFNNENALVNC